MMAEDCRIHERKPERADIFSILYGVPFSNRVPVKIPSKFRKKLWKK